MEFVRTIVKYRGGINVLCNEVFPVRIPDDQHSVQIVAVVKGRKESEV